ncbi:TonB-dependent receptor [Colwelliaceae bacterium MEBiC 14330]
MKTFAKNGLALAVSIACFTASAEQNDSANPNDQDLEKIVVTGQKLSRGLQETKESVEVFTNLTLEERNLETITDVFIQTPGVSGDQSKFYIRGVRSSDGSGNPSRGDLASVVIDGVTLSGWVKSEGAGQLWDVSQIEVLRGPQSTNLGRNALAGAVVVNTMDPVFYNEGIIRVGAGEYGKQELKGVANFNLVDDVSAIRISAESTKSDGYINNITRGEDDYGDTDHSVVRVKWLYQITDNLKSVFSYQHIESNYGQTISLQEDYDKADRINLSGDDSRFDTEADLASLNIDYFINDQWSMKSITAYQSGERSRYSDYDQTPRSFGNGGGIVSQDSSDDNWSQEFRFNYEGDGIRGSSGLYLSSVDAYIGSENQLDLALPALFDDFSQGLGAVLTTTAVLPVALYEPYFDTTQAGFTEVETSTWALFSEWEIDLTDKWMLSFGLRYDNEEQEFTTESNTVSNYVLPAMGGPFGAIPLAPGLNIDSAIYLINTQLEAYISSVPLANETEDFSNLLPHAGITYQWNDDVSTSFFVKKSYRSGGSELTLLNGVNYFDEEELWNYEASLRAVVLEGKGVFNANVYYSDWTDQQVAIQEPGTTTTAFTMTVNAGESTLYGAELSFDYALTDNLDLYTGLALSHTEYDSFFSPDGEIDYSGNSFLFAPEQTAVIGFYYENDNGLFINGNVSYTSDSTSRFFQPPNPTSVNGVEELKMDSYTLVNLNGGYKFENVTLEAYVKNATDELYDTNNNLTNEDGTASTILGAPREIGARVTVIF